MPPINIGASDNWSNRHPTELFRLYAFIHPKALLILIKEAFSEWGAHKVPRMSAALAYYTIFSLAPMLIIVTAVAGIAFGQKAAQGAVIGQIQDLLGQDNARAVQNLLKAAHKPVGGG